METLRFSEVRDLSFPNSKQISMTILLTISLILQGFLVAKPVNGQSNDTYQQHIERLKDRLPDRDFRIRIQKPFVVIGNESEDVLLQRCKTIEWAVNKLKELYFKDDPRQIIDIWLFKDKATYESGVEQLFGAKPTTPFGYYSSQHKALVMNISTGGGTLVHEIVHPFIERNFPDCPSWFNEGLASLYEQCGETEGKITGFVNWRLNGLQKAIAAGSLPAFQTLCETTSREFYNEDPGTNYSQSRYLCFYLQENGKLNQYYHKFLANAKSDPSGYQTLTDVLERTDMLQFQKEWQQFVLDLRFR